eukprot:3522876-Lingulodinium_polyedra.AAC.1
MPSNTINPIHAINAQSTRAKQCMQSTQHCCNNCKLRRNATYYNIQDGSNHAVARLTAPQIANMFSPRAAPCMAPRMVDT